MNNDDRITIKIPGGNVTIGPGTVPSSLASVPITSIEELTKSSREISKLGIFDIDENEDQQPRAKR